MHFFFADSAGKLMDYFWRYAIFDIIYSFVHSLCNNRFIKSFSAIYL